jgi:hypothetical protein
MLVPAVIPPTKNYPLTWKNVSSMVMAFLRLFEALVQLFYDNLLGWGVGTYGHLRDRFFGCDKPN